VRGDGTRVYFFEEQELRDIWSGNFNYTADSTKGDAVEMAPMPRFDIVNLAVDRRMLVNRQRKIKMYRCWMQGHFRKPAESVKGVATSNSEVKVTEDEAVK